MYKPNLNKRKRFNNKIVDIGIMIFSFIILVTTFLVLFTSCNKKDSDDVKPKFVEKVYQNGDTEPNYNVDTIINGLACTNLETRNAVRLIKPALNKYFNLYYSMGGLSSNYYYNIQRWEYLKNPPRQFNTILTVEMIDTFFVYNNELINYYYSIKLTGDLGIEPAPWGASDILVGHYNPDLTKEYGYPVFAGSNRYDIHYNNNQRTVTIHDRRAGDHHSTYKTTYHFK